MSVTMLIPKPVKVDNKFQFLDDSVEKMIEAQNKETKIKMPSRFIKNVLQASSQTTPTKASKAFLQNTTKHKVKDITSIPAISTSSTSSTPTTTSTSTTISPTTTTSTTPSKPTKSVTPAAPTTPSKPLTASKSTNVWKPVTQQPQPKESNEKISKFTNLYKVALKIIEKLIDVEKDVSNKQVFEQMLHTQKEAYQTALKTFVPLSSSQSQDIQNSQQQIIQIMWSEVCQKQETAIMDFFHQKFDEAAKQIERFPLLPNDQSYNTVVFLQGMLHFRKQYYPEYDLCCCKCQTKQNLVFYNSDINIHQLIACSSWLKNYICLILIYMQKHILCLDCVKTKLHYCLSLSSIQYIVKHYKESASSIRFSGPTYQQIQQVELKTLPDRLMYHPDLGQEPVPWSIWKHNNLACEGKLFQEAVINAQLDTEFQMPFTYSGAVVATKHQLDSSTALNLTFALTLILSHQGTMYVRCLPSTVQHIHEGDKVDVVISQNVVTFIRKSLIVTTNPQIHPDKLFFFLHNDTIDNYKRLQADNEPKLFNHIEKRTVYTFVVSFINDFKQYKSSPKTRSMWFGISSEDTKKVDGVSSAFAHSLHQFIKEQVFNTFLSCASYRNCTYKTIMYPIYSYFEYNKAYDVMYDKCIVEASFTLQM
jgi:hypothetical protein